MKNVMRAIDADLDNLTTIDFPVAVLCKKDGVRALVRDGDDAVLRCYSRTNKPHRNPHIQNLFARPEYKDFDSEGIVGADNDPLVSYKSSGGFSRGKDNLKEGKFIKVDAVLHVFDLIDHPGTYEERHAEATRRVELLLDDDRTLPICMIPYELANNAKELEAIEERCRQLDPE